jgi:serine/threonine protein phosphatase PrpC
MTILRAAWLSHIGNIRKENEDRVVFNESARIFGVADGVGGLPGGAEAAQKTVDVVTAAVLAAGPEAELDLREIVTAANEAVAILGQSISPTSGIGSTLTMGCIRGGRLKLAHVGDSRAFSWRNGEITCLTEDHTVENEARRRRARGEVVYYSEAQRGALTRCIGQTIPPDVDLADLQVLAGDRYVFCTDGITRLVFEREMREIVGRPVDPAAIARSLVELSLQRGGPDNATVAAVIIDSA